MASTLIFLSLAVLVCSVAGTALESLGAYDAATVSFELTRDGVTVPSNSPGCKAVDGILPEQCLVAQGGVTWDLEDSVTYTVDIPALPANATGAFVRTCFSDIDTMGRPWRKPGATVAENLKGQCQFVVADLDVGAAFPQTVTWTLPSTTPDAAMFGRVFITCGEGEYCGIGQTDPESPDLFLAVKMETNPPGMVVAVIICACVGPSLLIGYIIFNCFKTKSS